MHRRARLQLATALLLSTLLACSGDTPTEPATIDVAGLDLIITPALGAVPAGGTRQFTAVGRTSTSGDVRIPVQWSIVSGSGSIDSNGLLHEPAGASGKVTVRATSGPLSATSTLVIQTFLIPFEQLVVRPDPTFVKPGESRQFQAIAADNNGNEAQLPPVTWSVVNGGGTIDQKGFFSAGQATGTFAVKATAGGVSATATITIATTPPAHYNIVLGTLGTHGVLAGKAVLCKSSTIDGDVSVSPGDSIETGCESGHGVLQRGDAAAAQAQLDASRLYASLTSLPCSTTLQRTNADVHFTRGVYCRTGTLDFSQQIELDGGGDPDAQFIFQVSDSLYLGNIRFSNGAFARNVYFVAGRSVVVTSGWAGNIIAKDDITAPEPMLGEGRLLSLTGTVSIRDAWVMGPSNR
jgi:hypothetical protein